MVGRHSCDVCGLYHIGMSACPLLEYPYQVGDVIWIEWTPRIRFVATIVGRRLPERGMPVYVWARSGPPEDDLPGSGVLVHNDEPPRIRGFWLHSLAEQNSSAGLVRYDDPHADLENEGGMIRGFARVAMMLNPQMNLKMGKLLRLWTIIEHRTFGEYEQNIAEGRESYIIVYDSSSWAKDFGCTRLQMSKLIHALEDHRYILLAVQESGEMWLGWNCNWQEWRPFTDGEIEELRRWFRSPRPS